MGTNQVGRRGREFWAPVVAAFESTPQAHEAFAVARGLNVDTFRRWLYRLRRESTKVAGRFEMVSTKSVDVTRSRSACVVEVGTARILFEEAPSPEYLARLLSATGI